MKSLNLKIKTLKPDFTTIPFFSERGINIASEETLDEIFNGASCLAVGKVKKCFIAGAFAQAILELVAGDKVSIGTDSNNCPVVEYEHNGIIEVAADVKSTAESGYWLKAINVKEDGKRTDSLLPDVTDEKNTLDLLYFATIASVFDNADTEELRKIKASLTDCFEKIAKGIREKSFEEEELTALAVATQEMSKLLSDNYIYNDVEVEAIRKLSKKEESVFVPVEYGSGYGTDEIVGIQIKRRKFTVLQEKEADDKTATIKSMPLGKAMKIQSFVDFRKEINKTLKEEERALIPQLPENFPVEPEALEIAYNVCTYKKLGFDNAADAILRGEPGSGKTTAAKMVAALLGLPYLVLSCSAGSDELTVLGGVLPKTDDNEDNDEKETIIGWQAKTTVEEILYEPDLAYEKLTGVKEKGKSPEQVFQWVVTNANLFNKETKFEAVASPLVKALNRGWLVEIQEPTLIRDPGVLPKLNSFLEDNVITTDAGITYTRNGGVCLITTNVNCAGCTPLNASVQSRFTNVFEMDIPSAQKLKKRIKAELDFEDSVLLNSMIKVVTEINQYLNTNMIYDGTCGYRELRNWVMAYLYDVAVKGDAYESCISTVINKATSQQEYKEDIINILQKHF